MSSITIGQAGQNRYGTVRAGQVPGTNTNDSATAGYVGEYMQNTTTGATAGAASGYTTILSLSLTPGDWDLSVHLNAEAASGTVLALNQNNMDAKVTTNLNSGTGGTLGLDWMFGSITNTASPSAGLRYSHLIIPRVRVSLSSTTAYYVNVRVEYTGTAPNIAGAFLARRVR